MDMNHIWVFGILNAIKILLVSILTAWNGQEIFSFKKSEGKCLKT